MWAKPISEIRKESQKVGATGEAVGKLEGKLLEKLEKLEKRIKKLEGK